MQRCISLAESRLKREVKEVIRVKSLNTKKIRNTKKYKKNTKKLKFGCKNLAPTLLIFTTFHSPRPKASGIVTCIDFSRSLGELCNQLRGNGKGQSPCICQGSFKINGAIQWSYGAPIKISENVWVRFCSPRNKWSYLWPLLITGFFWAHFGGWTALSCVELGEPDLRLGVFRESSKDLPLAVQKPMVFFLSYTYLGNLL